MGTWGSGNFESDQALDFVNAEADRLINEIEVVFADSGRFRLDEDGEAVIIPSVVIMSLLCEHCHAVLPRTLDVAAWKARYLAMYDEQIDGMEPSPQFKEERRTIIAATFDRLMALHERIWRRE